MSWKSWISEIEKFAGNMLDIVSVCSTVVFKPEIKNNGLYPLSRSVTRPNMVLGDSSIG
jgi:hypothetical protein